MQISMDFSAQCNAQTKQVTPIEGMNLSGGHPAGSARERSSLAP